ncbi:YggS family pyridoxal phosphate-dependent enzyme [uncultured Phascolarctobacterium sp.]|uniref:YggS family pyridoxal phosphate-dependent enzyme n=1 Tax=Phascolarctobacterium sp. TaxID=2049039 RepID=UPI0025D0F205|nr:YggS family pyridoxal phosphate-dependent enzyme [uncultured Phascolarctobacterium sp.]
MLKDNLHKVQTQIAEALARRTEIKLTGDGATLVAVTKNHPVDVVLEALELGIANIGENRVQEAKEKRAVVPDRGSWHLIGHLQTNKAKQAVALFDLIESADSEHLLAALDKAAAQQGKVQDVLLQINIAREQQKTGFLPEDYTAILPLLDTYQNLRVRGLMVIAPLCENIEDTRPVFKEGYRCFCQLQAQRPGIELLSMGMTHDFTVAVEEGANIVRVGTALFGKRDYTKK